MMTSKQALLLAVLLLPTLVLGLIAAKNENDLANARVCNLKITGYDPRSLLYGRYINFRFDKQDTPEEQDCLNVINAKQVNHRYYMNEDEAPEMEALLRKPENRITMDVRVRAKGNPILGDLYINGQKWRDRR